MGQLTNKKMGNQKNGPLSKVGEVSRRRRILGHRGLISYLSAVINRPNSREVKI